MNRFTLPYLGLLGLILSGCGGSLDGSHEIGFKVVYSVTPKDAEVATGGSVDLKAFVLEGGYSDLAVSVREAEGGAVAKTTGGSVSTSAGAVPDGATYTAPANPGTFHVDVRFLSGTKVEATETATITVVVPPQGQ